MSPQSSNPYASNPFTPVFGKVPAYLAGRTEIIDEMTAAFDCDNANPALCSIFVGARGTGKTALLSYLDTQAEASGWVCANVTACEGMLDDVLQRSIEASRHLLRSKGGPKLKSLKLGAKIGAPLEIGGEVEASWNQDAVGAPNWRSSMNAILDQLAEAGAGLVITVDEVDPSLDEMAQLATTFQHFVREDRRVSLLMAGLPHNVSKLLSGKSTSFLRRAERHDLGSISSFEVEEAFRLTVESGGRTIEDDALEAAVKAIDGFPYMFQLVGYRSWNAAGKKNLITADDIAAGAKAAQRQLRSGVFDETLGELSPADMNMVRAIAADGESSTRRQVTERLGKPSSHVSTYKKRLLESGVIEEPRPGIFKFALPGLGDYVRNEYEY